MDTFARFSDVAAVEKRAQWTDTAHQHSTHSPKTTLRGQD
eukprot:SAG31_NODE_20020_length_586_cov_0.716632_1_plen_39_part_10